MPGVGTSMNPEYMRVFLIGLVLQIVLQRFPGGILPERRLSGAKNGKTKR